MKTHEKNISPSTRCNEALKPFLVKDDWSREPKCKVIVKNLKRSARSLQKTRLEDCKSSHLTWSVDPELALVHIPHRHLFSVAHRDIANRERLNERRERDHSVDDRVRILKIERLETCM